MTLSTVWWRQPARNWIDAVPIGDGRLGAKIFGGTDSERMALNIETLWSGKPQVHGVENGPATLRAMRESLLAGRRVEAEEINRAFQGPFNHAYQPLGDLLIDFTLAGDVTDYRHELDMSLGVATCTFSRNGIAISRRAFISEAGRALIVTIDASAELELRVGLKTAHPVHLEHVDERSYALAGFAPATIDREACHAAGQSHPAGKMAYADDAGVGFAAALQVVSDGASRPDSGALLVSGRSITFYISAATNFRDWREAPGRDLTAALATARTEAQNAADGGIGKWLELQARDHGALYRRASLHIDSSVTGDLPIDERMDRARTGDSDPAVFTALYAYARYLLISSSRSGNALPANLQGIWNDNRNPPWFSSFTTNINVQMNYWLAEPGNLAECAEPYLAYIESLAEAGTTTAREMFGFDGWCVAHNADIWRASWPSGEGLLRPTWSFEPTCGLWLAAAFAERAAFAPDDVAIQKRALALHEGAARFALDLLVRTERGLIVVPSVSPENNYVDPEGNEVDFDLQTTYELLLVRETFANYLHFARALNEENALTARVAQAFAEMTHPAIGPDGRLQEWSEPFPEPEPGHRHLSHLYGVFPGSSIDPAATPDYAQAARRSLDARMAGGAPEHGWPHAWMAALWARLGDSAKAEWVLDSFVRTSIPGSSLNYHSFLVYQIDGNLGIGAAISEMLLQSHNGLVRLFPALPSSWPSGQFHGFRARGGLTVSASWRDGRADVEIAADRDTEILFAVPGNRSESRSIRIEKNTPWRDTFALTPLNV